MTDQDRTSADATPARSGKSFWRRLIYRISAVCLIAIVAIVVVECLRPATYTSEACLMIRKNRTWLLDAPDDRDLHDENFIKNQFEILRSRKLLEPLAANAEIVQTPELAREIDIPAAIGRQLRIQQRGDSEFYIISFTSVSLQHAERIVKAVVDAYLTYHETSQARQNETLIGLLKMQGNDRFREMAQLRDQVKKTAIVLTGTDPFRPDQNEPLDASRELLKELQKELVRQQVQQELLAAAIAAGRGKSSESGTASGEADFDRHREAKEAYAAGESRVRGLQEEISTLVAVKKHFTGDTLELEALRNKLATVTAVHDALQARILLLTTEQNAPAQVQLFSQATRPAEADRKWWEFYR